MQPARDARDARGAGPGAGTAGASAVARGAMLPTVGSRLRTRRQGFYSMRDLFDERKRCAPGGNCIDIRGGSRQDRRSRYKDADVHVERTTARDDVDR